MRLSELIDPLMISTEIQGPSKDEVLEELGVLIARSHVTRSGRELSEAVPSAGSLQVTVMDRGIAVARPRAESRVVSSNKLVLGVGISRQGVDFDSWDGSPVGIILLVVTSAQDTARYLEVLSALFGLLAQESFKERLTAACTADDVVETFRHFEVLEQRTASSEPHPSRLFSQATA